MNTFDPSSIDFGKYELSSKSKSLALPKKAQEQFELGIWFAIYNWSVMDVAVEEMWGGADSSEKRDWLAGQIAELFETYSSLGIDDISERLLQVMADEFETVVDDESELKVAVDIIDIYKQCKEDDFQTVQDLMKKYQDREALRREGKLPKTKTEIVESSGSEDEEDDENDNDHNVPQLASEDSEMKEPEGPIIDEDGFQLVTKKGRGKR